MLAEKMGGLVGQRSRWPPNLRPIDFPRAVMTDWLGPGQLSRTGIMAVVSGVFGAYADQRSSMAALDTKPRYFDYSHLDDLWLDYVADLGDGFDATHTIARLLAQPSLTPRGGPALPRGRLLVLGGDEVYPTSGMEAYKQRTLLPYRAAMSAIGATEAVPDVFAIPGNHDWYDGLSSFRRVFCDQRWFGAWKTHQRRSYFALKLPHGWWLWGIDTQLGENIDQPQLDYFAEVARDAKGGRIILCTPQPGWVEGADEFRPIAFLEGDVIARNGEATLRLALSGDLHHYCHYESTAGDVHRITAGGGGAYLFGTQEMPATLVLEAESDAGVPPVTYTAKACYPDRATSKRLVWGCLLLPFKSRRFATFLAAIYALFCWFVQTASRATFVPDLAGPPGQPSSIMEKMKDWDPSLANAGRVAAEFFRVLAHSPSSTIFSLVLLGGAVAFCAAPGFRRILYGALHGIAHLTIAVAALWGASLVNLRLLGLDVDSIPQVLLFCSELAVFGSLAGGFLTAVYLVASSRLGGFHTNEAFSSQHIADYKNFLRLHLDAQGKLTVYPIGIEKATTDWTYRPEAQPGEPWFSGTLPEPFLIEGEIGIE
ncbi:MAG TPA: metallophosphoesterase [Thermoanaerobaculia bacterium]